MRAAVTALMGRRRSAVVQPSAQSLMFDGNSFLVGGSDTNIALMVRATAYGATFRGVQNIGVGGQTWLDMASASADLSAMLASGPGVLVLLETTNSVYKSGRSAAQVLADVQAYTALVRSMGFGGAILACGTIPRYENPAVYVNYLAANAAMSAVDSALAANPAAYGLDAFVDLRADGSPYAFTNYSIEGFQARSGYYIDGEPLFVHPNAAGGAYIAGRVVATLQALA